MRIITVVVLGLLLSSVALAGSTKDWDTCAGNDDDPAIAACARIITQGKESRANLAITYGNRGRSYSRKKDYDRAIADYDQAIKLNPKAETPLYNRALAYQNKGEDDRAIADYDQAIKLNPSLAEAFNNRGTLYGDKNEFDLAIADYDRAISLRADYPEAFNNRGAAYDNKGEYDRAIADFDQAIKLNPEYFGAYSNRGNAYRNKGDNDHAIAAYSEAIKLQPDDADDYYNRGLSYFLKKDYDRSLVDCEHAISLKADYPEAYACRGDAFFGKNDYDGAIAAYDKAIQVAGKDAWAVLYRSRADSLFNKGEFDQAIAGYEQSLRLDGKDAEAYKNRGATLCNKGDYDRGLADYEKALELKADDAKFYILRAWCLAQKGELDKALGDAERAVALMPDDAGIIGTRGEVYMRKGLLDIALADFDKAVSLDATLVEVYRDRGLLFEQKGDKDRALAEYRKALALKAKWVMEHRAQDEALARLTALATSGQSVPAAGAAREPASPATAALSRAPEKRIALVIGNGAYSNVKALKNADSDARAVAASFRRLGFEVIEKHDLTLPQLTAELKSFGDHAGNFDWAVVYYAGHGIEIGGINYLIPVDAELSVSSHVDDEAIPLDRVLSKVEGAHKLRLVILDACRENPFIAKMANAGATRSVGRGLARIEPEGGVMVAYSAKDGQVAQDGDGNNSPFAQALLDHLGEPGLEINMLFRKVRDDVRSRTNGQQEPFTYGSLPSEELFFKAAGQ
jgi:tetratricopeptide (TPR) repeat protein